MRLGRRGEAADHGEVLLWRWRERERERERMRRWMRRVRRQLLW